MSDLVDGYFSNMPFPEYEKVYNTILTSNPEITAQCYLGTPTFAYGENDLDSESDDDVDTSMGRFQGSSICDPFEEEPYNLNVISVEAEESLTFTEDELD